MMVCASVGLKIHAVLTQRRIDADMAVAYPGSVDTSWVDANNKAIKRAKDDDEAVAYPGSVDISWIDAGN